MVPLLWRCGLSLAALALSLTWTLAEAPTPQEARFRLAVFRAEVTKEQIPLLLAAGQDGQELGEQTRGKGKTEVEVYLTELGQAKRVRRTASSTR